MSLARLWLGFRKIVAVCVGVVWLSFSGLFLYYNYTRPTTRQLPERHYPIFIFYQGRIAWLNFQERHRLNVLEGVAEGLLVAGLACWLVEFKRSRKRGI